VLDAGVLPTPGVAYLAQVRELPGAMISASHNPFSDNGVKLFAPGGRKLTDDLEGRVAGEMRALEDAERRKGADVGTIAPLPRSASEYVEHVVAVSGAHLAGLRVVLDCANGAASEVAGPVLSAAGATVEVIHADPDGTNINGACGSTDPTDVQEAVVAAGADAGLAFDGDADRVLAVDHTGALIDGDYLLAICALDRHSKGTLAGGAVAVTVMSNLGFRLAMAERGIGVIETPVGDRYVLEALDRHGLVLGGEQSGHLIFRDVATTGDGLLTGLRVLAVAAAQGRPLRDLAGEAMTSLPQVLKSVRATGAGRLRPFDVNAEIGDELASLQAELGEHGRIVVRPSGTEPVVRVMVEAPTAAEAERIAQRLCAVVAERLGPAADA
jgi:phosphoglucosamine mutase